MNIYTFLIIIILFLVICFVGVKFAKKKKLVLLASALVIIIIGIIGIGYIQYGNNEQYIRVNENNEEVSIKLNNHKEYYGYKFYRFSSFQSENELIQELKENGYDADYDNVTKKIIIRYKENTYEITMEKSEKWFSIMRCHYIFARQYK